MAVGRSAYLKVIDDDGEICDATNLRGAKDIEKTSDELTSRYESNGVIVIGIT